MNIAILGGTGKEGAGLATRWALVGHSIIIGSRDAERAKTKAAELREQTQKLTIIGEPNAEAARLGSVVVIALPAQGLRPDAKIVAAFHHIAAHELSEMERPIECDLLLCGGDAAAKETVGELGRSLGLRPIDVGGLSNAGPLEGITAVLATINRRYKLKNSGIKITGL